MWVNSPSMTYGESLEYFWELIMEEEEKGAFTCVGEQSSLDGWRVAEIFIGAAHGGCGKGSIHMCL